MNMFIFSWILLATLAVSVLSLIGAASFLLRGKTLKKIIPALVALAAGSLLGGSFFHLIPEAYENDFPAIGITIVSGFLLFFLIERYLHWHHHEEKCVHDHSLGYLVLFGDALHNLIDGMIIAAAFLVDIPFGITTTLIVMAHEIPQEIGDLGILLHSGFSKRKALLMNFLTALTAIIGAVVAYFFSSGSELFAQILIPLAAGGFIYIAASDLIPEMHRENNHVLLSFLFFILGLSLMYALTFLEALAGIA